MPVVHSLIASKSCDTFDCFRPEARWLMVSDNLVCGSSDLLLLKSPLRTRFAKGLNGAAQAHILYRVRFIGSVNFREQRKPTRAKSISTSEAIHCGPEYQVKSQVSNSLK